MSRRERDALIRNGRPLRQERLYTNPRRKMPKKGSQIKIIHDGTYDLSRIEAIIKRYGLSVEFVEKKKEQEEK